MKRDSNLSLPLTDGNNARRVEAPVQSISKDDMAYQSESVDSKVDSHNLAKPIRGKFKDIRA